MAGSIASNSSHGSSKAAPANRSNRFGCLCTKWRIIQWAVFVALVIGVAVATYQLVSQHEENDFEEAVSKICRQCNFLQLNLISSGTINSNLSPPSVVSAHSIYQSSCNGR